jgi:hypothetical protein
MAPATAASFMLLGSVLYGVTRPRTVAVAQALAGLIAGIGLFSLIGYVYGSEELIQLASCTPMAAHTGAAFMALGLGVLCARPEAGLMRIVTSGTTGGVAARRVLMPVMALAAVLVLAGGVWFYRIQGR